MDRMGQERWERLYGQRERILKFHQEPYLSLMIPHVATAMNLTEAPAKRLVIGGGRGHFSHDVLPSLQHFLRTHPGYPRIENVLETDITPEIAKAPGETKIVNILDLSKHFKPGSFTLVVGESVIHQLHPLIPQALEQIKHVLVPGGVFLHVQDAIPHPPIWLTPQTAEKYGIHDENANFENLSLEQREQVAKEAHLSLMHVLSESAQTVGMNFQPVRQETQTVQDARTAGKHPTLDMTGRNYVTYEHGNVKGGHAEGLARGKIVVGYGGIFTYFIKPR